MSWATREDVLASADEFEEDNLLAGLRNALPLALMLWLAMLFLGLSINS